MHFNKKDRKQAENTMLIPMLKNAVKKYHTLYETHQAKALSGAAFEKNLLYKIKGKGQWTLANSIGGKTLPPLSAVRRKKKGPNGEPIGSIATSQTEVASIVRLAYQEVCKGNMVDTEAATKRYLEDYEPYIYNGKEVNMTLYGGWPPQGDGNEC